MCEITLLFLFTLIAQRKKEREGVKIVCEDLFEGCQGEKLPLKFLQKKRFIGKLSKPDIGRLKVKKGFWSAHRREPLNGLYDCIRKTNG